MNKLHAIWALTARGNSQQSLCAGLQGELYEEHGKPGTNAIGLAL